MVAIKFLCTLLVAFRLSTCMGNVLSQESFQGNLRRGTGTSNNKDEVQASIESKCDVTLWGDHVKHEDYYKIISAVVADTFGGGGSATSAYLYHLLERQMDALGDEALKAIVNGGHREIEIDGIKVDVKGAIASYNHVGWTWDCCRYDGYKTCCCKECGRVEWPMFNTHQPYICFRGKDGKNIAAALSQPHSESTATNIRNINHHDLCVDIHAGDNNAYMYNCHNDKNQKFYFDGEYIKTPWNTAKCLDYNYANGNVYMADCHNGSNQKWVMEGGTIKTKYDMNLCLDRELSKKNLYMSACHGGWNQLFEWAV